MVLEFYWILLTHLSLNSILFLTTFIHFYEMFIGVHASLTLFHHFFVLRRIEGEPSMMIVISRNMTTMTPTRSLMWKCQGTRTTGVSPGSMLGLTFRTTLALPMLPRFPTPVPRSPYRG
jgi:hypothetical protein